MSDVLYYVEITERQPIIVEVTTQVNSITIEVKDSDQYQLVVSEPINYSVEISEKLAINNIDNLIAIMPCDDSVYVGSAVYLKVDNGAVKAYNAIATSQATSNVFGIVEEKSSPTVARIRFGGLTKSIFINLDLTQEYYLSDLIEGHMVAEDNKPIQIGSILVKIGQPYSSTQMLYSRGGKVIVSNYVEATGAISFGFTGDIAVDAGDRANTVDIIDNGERFV